jgi:hypothetical protein
MKFKENKKINDQLRKEGVKIFDESYLWSHFYIGEVLK